jgi:Fe-S cluster assembly iron-binding protein IscA
MHHEAGRRSQLDMRRNKEKRVRTSIKRAGCHGHTEYVHRCKMPNPGDVSAPVKPQKQTLTDMIVYKSHIQVIASEQTTNKLDNNVTAHSLSIEQRNSVIALSRRDTRLWYNAERCGEAELEPGGGVPAKPPATPQPWKSASRDRGV